MNNYHIISCHHLGLYLGEKEKEKEEERDEKGRTYVRT